MLQCRSEKEKLQEYIRKNKDYFENVDVETYQAMRELLRSERIMRDMSSAGKEGKIDMCRAMEEWYADAVREGREAGMEQGIAEGLAEGRAKGRAEGRAEGRKVIIRTMLTKGLSPEEIASYTDATDEEIDQVRKEMEK